MLPVLPLLALAASLAGTDRWARLASRLPSRGPAGAPKPPIAPSIILYRDTNGWCPFCERIWLQLEAKGLQYEEVLINLADKPQWYKDMVPTTLVPAVKIHAGAAEPEVVWESEVIMRRIEDLYPERPMLPSEGSEARAASERLLSDVGALYAAGFQYASAARNSSLADADVAERRAAFEAKLDKLDAAIGQHGGPFLVGSTLGMADAMYAPVLERWAVQLPLTTGSFHLRPPAGSLDAPRWPRLELWFQAMDAEPAYSRVRGDPYSWSAAVGAFQRIFAGNASLTDAQREVVRRADSAALVELKRAGAGAGSKPAAALTAAERLISNWKAVVADATAAEAKSQKTLARLDADDADQVELMLADCVARLLDVGGHWRKEEDGEDGADERRALREVELYGYQAFEHKMRADAARFVASRLCAPRDMGADAAAAMRAVLLALAAESESLAWQKSGGMY